MAHPRESEEWRGMTMTQRYEFFAPIWRVMRDSNMTAEDVREQRWACRGVGVYTTLALGSRAYVQCYAARSKISSQNVLGSSAPAPSPTAPPPNLV
eukprot:355823-Chlamydomonas_euryale.AAC.2